MFVAPEDERNHKATYVYTEVIGIIIISYAFIAPIDFSTKILIALIVTFLCELAARAQNSLVWQNKILASGQYVTELTFRCAISNILEKHNSGAEISPDWQRADEFALQNIEENKQKERLLDRGSSKFHYGAWIIFSPVMIIIRPVVGYAIAFLLDRYLPDFVLLII
jgi:hypothetical protein